MRSYEAKKGLKLKALIRNRIKTYILVWDDYPKLDGLTKRDKIQNKMRIDMISIRLLQTAYFHTADTCK